MPENHRAPRPDIVDILMTINVPQISPLGTLHKRRLAAYRSKGTGRAVHSAGDYAAGSLEGGIAG